MLKQIKDAMWVGSLEELNSEAINRAYKISSYMETYKYNDAVMAYEDIQLYMWRRMLELTKLWMWWASNEKYPLISWAYRTYTGMINKLKLDNVIVDTYLPSPSEEVLAGIENYKYLTTYFLQNKDNRKAWVAIKNEAIAIWSAFGKVSWKTNKSRVVKSSTKWKDGKYIFKYEDIEYGYPVLEYISYFHIIRDVTNANKNIWYWHYVTKADLKNVYWVSDETMKEIDKWWKQINFDFDKVKDINSRDVFIKEKCSESLLEQLSKYWWVRMWWATWLPKHDDWYALWSSDQKTYQMIEIYVEVWSETYKIQTVNGELISYWDANLPFSWSPIVQLDFITMPWEVLGIGIWQMGRWYQKNCDTLYNGMITANKISVWPMFSMEQDPMNKMEFFNYRPFWIIENSIWMESLEKIELVDRRAVQQNMDAIRVIETKFNDDLWLNPYITWAAWGIERSAEWVRQRKAWSNNKTSEFVDNIDDFYSDVAEKMVLLWKVYWDDIAVKEKGKRQQITKKDIHIWYKISFDAADITWEKAAEIQDAISIMNIIDRYNIDADTQEPIINNRELVTQILDKAKLHNIVKWNSEKLEELKQKKTYIDEKQKILSEWAPPQSPIDKVNLTINFADMAQYPEAQQILLQQAWLLQQQPQQQWWWAEPQTQDIVKPLEDVQQNVQQEQVQQF